MASMLYLVTKLNHKAWRRSDGDWFPPVDLVSYEKSYTFGFEDAHSVWPLVW